MNNFRSWFDEKSEEAQEQFLGEYPRLLLEGNKYPELFKLLSNYCFIEAKINHPSFGVQSLIEDYDLLEDEAKTLVETFHGTSLHSNRNTTISSLKKIQGALRLSAHIINQYSQQLPAQLTGRLLHFHTPEINNLLQQISTDQSLRCLTPSLTPPGSPLIRTLSGHSSRVNAIALTPDGKTVISGSRDNTIKIWDLDTGTEKFTLQGHRNSVRAISVTPDGKTVISGSDDNTIKIWDVVTETEKFTLLGHSSWVSAISVTPDGKTVISGSDDNTIKIWDVVTETEKFTLLGHSSWVSAIALTPDGKTVISGSRDNTIKIWDLVTGTEKFTLKGHSDSVSAIALTPDGKTVISRSDDNTIKIWDLATRKEIATFTGESPIKCCAVAPDGVTIVAGEQSGRLHFLRLQGKVTDE
jgi:WD40 repeat protein